MRKDNRRPLWQVLCIYAAIAVSLCAVLYFVGEYYILPQAKQGEFYYHSVNAANADAVFVPQDSFHLEQTFEAKDSIFGYEIALCFPSDKQAEREKRIESSSRRKTQEKLTISLLDSEKNIIDHYELTDEEIDFALTHERIYRYYYGNPIMGNVRGQTYTLSIDGEFQKNTGVGFYISDRDYYQAGALQTEEAEDGHDLCFLVSSYSYTMIRLLFLAFSIGLLAAFTIIYFCAYVFRCKKHILFFVTVIIMGMGYSVIMSPYSVTDEERHFHTAYRVSNYLTFTEESTDDPGEELYIRACDTDNSDIMLDIYGRYFIPSVNSYAAMVNDVLDTGNHNMDMVLLKSERVSGNYICYLMSGLGIAIGRTLNLGFTLTFYLGRMMNLLWFAIMGSLAVKKLPFGKNVLFGISLMPLMLQQAASYSYDSVTAAFSFYFIAACLDISYRKEKIRFAEVLQLLICVIVFASVRGGVLLFLLPLLILLFQNPQLSKKQKWLAVGGTVITAGIAFVVLNIWRFNTGDATAVTDTVPSYGLDYIFKDTKGFIELLMNTYFQEKERWFYSLFGSYMSWVSLEVEKTFALVFAALLFVASIRGSSALETQMRNRDKFVFALIVVLLTIGFLAAGFLWTQPDSPYITGVETRYILTVMPLILLLLRNRTLVCKKDITAFLTTAFILTNILYLVDLFKVILLA